MAKHFDVAYANLVSEISLTELEGTRNSGCTLKKSMRKQSAAAAVLADEEALVLACLDAIAQFEQERERA